MNHFDISLIFSTFIYRISIRGKVNTLNLNTMLFELLLIIYLLPVILIAVCLCRFAIWLIKKLFALAWWTVKTCFSLLWKGLVLAFALVFANVASSSHRGE